MDWFKKFVCSVQVRAAPEHQSHRIEEKVLGQGRFRGLASHAIRYPSMWFIPSAAFANRFAQYVRLKGRWPFEALAPGNGRLGFGLGSRPLAASFTHVDAITLTTRAWLGARSETRLFAYVVALVEPMNLDPARLSIVLGIGSTIFWRVPSGKGV